MTFKTGTDLVFYNGANLPCSGVDTCDNLTLALQKIDAKICPEAIVASFLTAITTNVSLFNAVCNALAGCVPTTTTTTTTTIACRSYTVFGGLSGGTVSWQNCDGGFGGAPVSINQTINTGCVVMGSVELTGTAQITATNNCGTTTTTTTLPTSTTTTSSTTTLYPPGQCYRFRLDGGPSGGTYNGEQCPAGSGIEVTGTLFPDESGFITPECIVASSLILTGTVTDVGNPINCTPTTTTTSSTSTSTTTTTSTSSTSTTTTSTSSTTTSTSSTTTTTTTFYPPDTQPIEDYGAKAYYLPQYNQFDIVPLPGEGKSEITYTGTTDIFSDPEFVSNVANMEFVLFEGHLNPSTYPTNGIVNGNYTPSVIGARYSKVTDIISGKKVKVDFVYNGGNLVTPQSQTNKSGYFFIDNRAAFRTAFNNNSTRATNIWLKAGKTYVTKGGWNSTTTKNLIVAKDTSSSDNAAIKISMEDAFSLTPDGQSYNFTEASLGQTFNSPYFFLLTSASNNGMDIIFNNIDILPSHMTRPSAQFSNSYAQFPFFSHLLNTAELERYGTCKVFNSNGLKEKEYLDANPATFTTPPTFILPQFAFSNNGGRLNGGQTDIQDYQYFTLEQSKWQALQFHNIKFQTVNGNYLKLIGSPAKKTEAYISDINDTISTSLSYQIQIQDDGTGKFRKLITTDQNKNFYILANQYWYGTGINNAGTFTDTSNRLQWFSVPYGGQTYYFFPPNQASVQQGYGGTYGSIPTIPTGNQINMYEEVPRSGITTITIDNGTASINKKIDNTTYDIYGWGLQAQTTYPSYNSSYVIPGSGLASGDTLTYNSNSYNIVSRKRIVNSNARYTLQSANGGASSSTVTYTTPTGTVMSNIPFTGTITIDTNGTYTASSGVSQLSESAVPGYPVRNTVGWRIVINNPITDSTPFTFTVSNSHSEFILSGATYTAGCKIYTTGGYFCYASYNMNFEFENAKFNGFGRFTDNPKNMNGTNHTWSNTSPLYLLTIKQSFKDSEYDSSNPSFPSMSWESTGANGLEWRNLSTLTPPPVTPYAVEIDNSRVWWSRPYGTTPGVPVKSNPVRFSNRPTLIVSLSYGEPRIYDPIIADSNGFIVEGGISFYFSDSAATYDLSNVLINPAPYNTPSANSNFNLWGTGNVIVNNFDISPTYFTLKGFWPSISFANPGGSVFPQNGVTNSLIVPFINLTGNVGKSPVVTLSGALNNGSYPSTNRVILTNWTLLKTQFGNLGYNSWAGGGWPASTAPGVYPTPVLPNFSIS